MNQHTQIGLGLFLGSYSALSSDAFSFSRSITIKENHSGRAFILTASGTWGKYIDQFAEETDDDNIATLSQAVVSITGLDAGVKTSHVLVYSGTSSYFSGVPTHRLTVNITVEAVP